MTVQTDLHVPAPLHRQYNRMKYGIKILIRAVLAAQVALPLLLAASGAGKGFVPAQDPDLTWNPTPFEATSEEPVRFIDFSAGDDANPGTHERPWKHHPWDPNARGRAAQAHGIRTYVFKQGVVYRGLLKAKESGTAQHPIRLTVDPHWGSGEAVLSGAEILSGVWQHCATKLAELLPPSSRRSTYCLYTAEFLPLQGLWQSGETVAPIHPARYPNWSRNPSSSLRAHWFELDNSAMELEIGLSSTEGIHIGDHLVAQREATADLLSGVGNKHPGWVVASVTPDSVIVLAAEALWPRGGLATGMRLTNGVTSPEITRISAGHSLIRRLYDKDALSNRDPGSLAGATIHVELPSTERTITGTVLDNDASKGFLRTNLHLSPGRGPRAFDRYFLEGLPSFLDTPGEVAAATDEEGRGILFLRLPGDHNPNDVALEKATRRTIIDVENQQHIEISGLSFRIVAVPPTGTMESRNVALYSAAIQVRGNSAYIQVDHCRFRYLESGIVGYPTGRHSGELLDHLAVTDNTFSDIGGSAVILGNGSDRAAYAGKARLVHVSVLRNRILSSGELPLSRYGNTGSVGHGIDIHGAEVAEVAYNYVQDIGGAGINLYLGGTWGKGGIAMPFLRGLIHHNKVANSLLAARDFGGIESWLGGPMYIYDNISINPEGYGYGHYRRKNHKGTFKEGSYGAGIYLDGQYKSYVFNNIVWGVNNDVHSGKYNAAAFNEAAGFLNTVFSNTFLNFGVGLHKGKNQHNRSYYLGNLLLDMGYGFILHEARDRDIEYESLAYNRNIFRGKPEFFGKIGRAAQPAETLAEWRTFLESKHAMEADTGILSTIPVVRSMEQRNFRLAPGSPAIDGGARVFVPWALSRVVGEWNFFKSRTPRQVRDESLNINQTWVRSSMAQDIPRLDLECPRTTASDYVPGILEDWITGALALDGRTQYCKLDNAAIKAGFTWHDIKTNASGTFSGNQRDTVDINRESFLIEVVLAAAPNPTASGILGKTLQRGYSLDLDQTGTLRLSLDNGNKRVQAVSKAKINDSKWHHVIVEIDRHRLNRVSFYIDGKVDSSVAFPPDRIAFSLSNDGDFEVGRSAAGYFHGRIDFLRLSKDTLADADTTISELYAWEFNGPQLHDFTGARISGTTRDAGAVESEQ